MTSFLKPQVTEVVTQETIKLLPPTAYTPTYFLPLDYVPPRLTLAEEIAK